MIIECVQFQISVSIFLAARICIWDGKRWRLQIANFVHSCCIILKSVECGWQKWMRRWWWRERERRKSIRIRRMKKMGKVRELKLYREVALQGVKSEEKSLWGKKKERKRRWRREMIWNWMERNSFSFFSGKNRLRKSI